MTNGFPKKGHDHGLCSGRALERAAGFCRERGLRLTDLRRRVLEIVWTGHRPFGAYEILEILRRKRPSAQPPTVYRALDFLRDNGFVHRIESLNAFVGCSAPDRDHRGQFLICRTCGRAAEIPDSGIEAAISKSAAEAGFKVLRPTVEVEGLCPRCR